MPKIVDTICDSCGELFTGEVPNNQPRGWVYRIFPPHALIDQLIDHHRDTGEKYGLINRHESFTTKIGNQVDGKITTNRRGAIYSPQYYLSPEDNNT